MAIKECGRGHMYDTNMYASCPYCNGGQQFVDFNQPQAPMGGVPVGAAGATQAPMGYNPAPYQGGFAPDPVVAPTMPVSVDAGGVTMPPLGWQAGGDSQKVTDDNKTMPVVKVQDVKSDMGPVVGWLVCVEGKSKGTDYRLYSKINTIGRGEKMDVRIKEDLTVTKDVHARLAYDTKRNEYTFIPGNNANNIYVNDDPVYMPVRLNAYDVIVVGESVLIFIPLCTGKFTWEKGLQKEDTANGTI
jgi:hypothetical protein